jgi:transcriptional regulator with XRE-family HTH domain
VGHYKNQKLIKLFAERLKNFRLAANLSVKQLHISTGISDRQIMMTEAGNVNTSISLISLYADIFGVPIHVLLNFDEPIPDETTLRTSIKKFIKARGLDPSLIFKADEGATSIIESQLLKTSFLNTPRFASEIANYCKEKYKVTFTTMRISKVLDNLNKKGVVEKLKTDKKTKFQYRKK